MRPITSLFILSSLLLSAATASAQYTAADYTVQAAATVQETPPQITVHWARDAFAQSYSVFRRELGQFGAWGTAHSVAGTDTFYVDNGIVAGKRYEYRIAETAKRDTVYYAYGFVATGIKVPAPANRGTVILLVDNTYAADLKPYLDTLRQDLLGEGWNVLRHDVSRTAEVSKVRDMLISDLDLDPVNLRSLFIIGHVPVPYSGDIVPDGHTPGNGNHQGAWAADVYYGQLDADWGDDQVNDVTADRPENKNIPGDGKFDQSEIPAEMTLEVGRVDFANMPYFTKSEKDLLISYLQRDHAYRTGKLQMPNRALVNINFGVFTSYDVPGEDAWRNFPPLVGKQNIVDLHSVTTAGDWFSYLDTAKYLWAYGCGPGWYNSCGGVGTTQQFATNGASAAFYMLFGSFFGDWDSPNNLTRAPLATDYGLTSCWVSRPFWFFHPLGIGETFGYCTKLTQNNSGNITVDANKKYHFNSDYVWGYAMQGVHVALMGDPTLRMTYAAMPVSNVTAQEVGNGVALSWAANPTAPAYNIYRSSSSTGPWTKLNTDPVTTATYTDLQAKSDSNFYSVRSTALALTPSGSYWDESVGAMRGIKVLASVSSESKVTASLRAVQNGDKLDIVRAAANATSADLYVLDVTGREVLPAQKISSGSISTQIDISSLAPGVYFIRLTGNGETETAKVLIK